MGLKCLKCERVIEGSDGMHLGECPCGNKDIHQFIRVPDTNINTKKKEKMKEWLEARKAD